MLQAFLDELQNLLDLILRGDLRGPVHGEARQRPQLDVTDGRARDGLVVGIQHHFARALEAGRGSVVGLGLTGPALVPRVYR